MRSPWPLWQRRRRSSRPARRASRSGGAGAVSFEEGEDGVTATIRFEGAKLNKTGILVRDADLGDGEATLEIWQGAIDSSVEEKKGKGLALRIERAPARLQVVVTADSDTFGEISARLTPDGKSVVLTARPAV